MTEPFCNVHEAGRAVNPEKKKKKRVRAEKYISPRQLFDRDAVITETQDVEVNKDLVKGARKLGE